MTKGLDVSHFNGSIDWASVSGAGCAFAFAKASEGLGMLDVSLAPHVAGAHASGLRVGAYHFLRPELDGGEQAAHFMTAIAGVRDALSLPPAVDVEFAAASNGSGADAWGQIAPDVRIARLRNFLEAVQSHYGETPMVYCSPGWWNGLFEGADFSSYPLWVAHYGVSEPSLPAGWERWTVWQQTSQGTVPGAGTVDVDVWNGDLP